MLIKFQYQDKSTRFINPSESFFQRDQKGKIDIKLLTEKLRGLAGDTGRCFSIECYYGDVLLHEEKNEKFSFPENDNVTKEEYARRRQSKKAKLAHLKKDLISKEFTIASINGVIYNIADLKKNKKSIN